MISGCEVEQEDKRASCSKISCLSTVLRISTRPSPQTITSRQRHCSPERRRRCASRGDKGRRRALTRVTPVDAPRIGGNAARIDIMLGRLHGIFVIGAWPSASGSVPSPDHCDIRTSPLSSTLPPIIETRRPRVSSSPSRKTRQERSAVNRRRSAGTSQAGRSSRRRAGAERRPAPPEGASSRLPVRSAATVTTRPYRARGSY